MLWAERGAKGTREGNSVGLQILILAQVTVTWMPPGLGWWTSVSPCSTPRSSTSSVPSAR